ncbi:NRDE family protein [Flagellimonas aequoris]|uniref:NRDE family protein n=1 Tax=Flagellimonas aequoris TaxID=2306997 RepID=A0A418N270_9FLAO|nr:NRDE family protein [Allomuricauda aequoris]RIV67417.1 hypothetical protein D2U88_17895 [Allomuricauda aequoris]TXJ99239.1 NRDE family protein [Allomuricauda aequoris]
MCTVSFMSQGDTYLVTSNRDEHISRPRSLEPKEETVGPMRVLFPKDPRAGGTWFAVNEVGVVAVLLNGAFVGHLPNGNYAKSRGLIVLDVISSKKPEQMLEQMDLCRIEPFTLVLFNSRLLEFRWDGNQKYFRPLDKSKNHIWSSATLYQDAVIEHRARLFDRFTKENTLIKPQDVLNFHSNNHDDFENGFIIDRETGLKTFSVTQVVLDEEETLMRHVDLLNDKRYEVPFSSRQLIL